ncbi:ABC transporter permease [Halobellus limi]|uniref:ABC transporter permease n=1 Tax=Halobellus limi TaxID=699433 RepID=A0A1H5TWA4_9EURY|nr:ABC transporter permease [Halobellus limi]QCC47230.1 ABC transporter permease [Halobellus limi]SEF66301.1 putative ABC transport system permease protein [Halobellus limi]
MGSRHRYAGLLGVALGRLAGRFRRGEGKQLAVSVLGVAIAIMVMVTVGGVALGLASQSAIQGDDVDYWIVPEDRTASSIAVSVDGPQLGGTHDVTARLNRNPQVEYATPVLLRVVQLRAPASDTSEFVLVAGVIPDGGDREVLGVSTAALTPGDPYYANGTYDGEWTGEVVASGPAAELLALEGGDPLATPRQGSNRSLHVENVSTGSYNTGAGPLPIVVVHQSELQAITGATAGDPADQILVSTTSAGVRSELEALYPQSSVITKSGFAEQSVSTSSLPVAVALTAVLTAVVVGTLFVATMMGLELHADRRRLAVLAAIGYRTRSQAFLVVAETFILTLCGTVVGIALGVGGIAATNALATRYLGVQSVAVFDPILVGAAGAVAVLIAAAASIYPVWLTRRTDVLEVLG